MSFNRTTSSTIARLIDCASSCPCDMMSASKLIPADGTYIAPGEYARHDCIWFCWPTYAPKHDRPSELTILTCIHTLAEHVTVNLVVQSAEEEEAVRALALDHRMRLSHVTFHYIEHSSIWIRDFGPQFVTRDGRIAIVDWSFNCWGYERLDAETSVVQETVHRRIAQVLGAPLIDVADANGHRLVHEGGGFSHNGYGTMIAVESVVMQRTFGSTGSLGGPPLIDDANSPTTYAAHAEWLALKPQVEETYRKTLGATQVIWMPTGVIEDNGSYRAPAGEHIRVGNFKGAMTYCTAESIRWAEPTVTLTSSFALSVRTRSY